MRRLTLMALAFVTACAPMPTPQISTRANLLNVELPAIRGFEAAPAGRPKRANADIAEDFLDLAFRMESGRTVPMMTRFEQPVSVRVTGPAPPSLIPDLRGLLARLRSEAGIDIRLTGAADAGITVETVPRGEMQRAVPRAACFVVPRVNSWAEFKRLRRTPRVDWTTLTRRDRATIFLPTNVAPQEIRDCLHEELAQALGPLNDLYRLPDSVFNDDNIHAVLTGFDMLVLRAYYAPELQSGMTRGEVAARLPALLARLNPAGQSVPRRYINDTSRDWIVAMESALSPGGSPLVRRRAAEDAINLSRAFGWRGTRAGFALYAYGRLQMANAPDLALAAFEQAAREFRAVPDTDLHQAHVTAQLAAFALRAGDAAGVLGLVEEAIPVARRAENAALLATLMMFRAEALDLQGRHDAAEAVRLDSLGWARYGLGSDDLVRARLAEIGAIHRGLPR